MSVDIIIPVYKPDEKLDQLLQWLGRQSVKPDKIIILNTEVLPEFSTTVVTKQIRAIMKEQVASHENAIELEVYPIKQEEFDHGATRAYGAKQSTADYMIFMTQDAIPKNEQLVEALLKPFVDETISIVYARQLANKGAGVIESYTRTFNYPETSCYKTEKDLPRLGIKTYFCSDVCAAYRKKHYEEVGGFIKKAIFNEDMIIASQLIKRGRAVYYAPDAMVYHSHKYTYWQQFTRNFDLAVSQRQYREIFDSVPSESEGMRLVKQTMQHLFHKKKYLAIIDLILQSGFKYMGYFLGKRYELFPKGMVRRCSMNKGFWRDGNHEYSEHRHGDL